MELVSEKLVQGHGDQVYVSYGDDNGLHVEFYIRPVRNEYKSNQAGYSIFENKEYVRIQPIGDKTKVRDRPVKLTADAGVPADPVRFPRQWAAFKNQQTQVVEGLPVEEWAPITPADAAMLKGLNIHTVEALSQLSDNNLTFLGARGLRDKAKVWLETAKKGAPSMAQQQEINDLKAQLEAMRNQMQGLPAPAKVVKKRGRKPKNGTDVLATDAGGM